VKKTLLFLVAVLALAAPIAALADTDTTCCNAGTCTVEGGACCDGDCTCDDCACTDGDCDGCKCDDCDNCKTDDGCGGGCCRTGDSDD